MRRLWRTAEAVAWLTGIVLLAGYGAWALEGVVGSHRALRQFGELQAAAHQPAATPDVTLWSQVRIDAWRSTLDSPGPPPLGVLRIPRIRLDVPIFSGTDEVTLNRGAGHIEDTAFPGSPGNAGLAAHRDGFFRGLKDVETGDTIELETLDGKSIYRVERMWVVDPEDVSVLAPAIQRSLTLVTCYPFYFVGPAPKRYIIRAVIADTAERDR